MARPSLLLLDEPSLASPLLVEQLGVAIADPRTPGHVDPARRAERRLALEMAATYVVQTGRVALSGPANGSSREIRRAYLACRHRPQPS
jgi:ABC-type branched-subunit amino acid transport system ATPase component